MENMGYRSDSIAISRDMGPLSRCFCMPTAYQQSFLFSEAVDWWCWRCNGRSSPTLVGLTPFDGPAIRNANRADSRESTRRSVSKSGVAPANQTKERAKRKVHDFALFFCVNSGVFPWENKHDSRIELLFRNAPAKSSWTDLSLVWFAGATPEEKNLRGPRTTHHPHKRPSSSGGILGGGGVVCELSEP